MSDSQELLRASLLAFMTFLQPSNAILNVLSLRNNCKTSGVFLLMEGSLNHIRFWNATLNPCNQQNHLNSHPSSAGSNIVVRDNQISLCKFRPMDWSSEFCHINVISQHCYAKVAGTAFFFKTDSYKATIIVEIQLLNCPHNQLRSSLFWAKPNW